MSCYGYLVLLLLLPIREIAGEGDWTKEYVTLKDGHTKVKLYKKQKNWHTAQLHCEKEGAYLATIESAGVRKRLKKEPCDGAYWLGGRDLSHNSDWKWVTGPSFKKRYTPAFSGGWTYGYGCAATCVESVQKVNDGKLYDMDCSSTMSFLCMKDGSPGSKNATNYLEMIARKKKPVDVTKEYVGDGNTEFRFYTQPKDWYSAQKQCEKDGAHLAVVKNDAAWEGWKKTPCDGVYWLGGRDAASNNNWKWVTGSSVPAKYWSRGEPSNDSGRQDNCIASCSQNDNGYLYGVSCDVKLAFLCMKDRSPESKYATNYLATRDSKKVPKIGL